MATILSPAASRWFGEHHGVATVAELRALGLGRKATDRLCAVGVLHRVARGVYVLATALQTLEHRCRLLCCLHPGGFVTGPTAAKLGGLRRQPTLSALHFSVLHGVHLHHVDGVRFRQTTKLRPSDRRTRKDGIVVAAWPRLSFDIAADLPPLDHRSVVHQLRDRGLVTDDELLSIGEWLCHPARRGTTTFRLSMLDLGHEPQDSHPELFLLDALLRRNVPVEPQFPIVRTDGVTAHVDLAVPAARWGVELDIHPEHRSVDGHHRDAGRVRSLHLVGWEIEPVAELDLGDVERVADDLAALYFKRARAIGVPEDPTGGAPHSGALWHSGLNSGEPPWSRRCSWSTGHGTSSDVSNSRSQPRAHAPRMRARQLPRLVDSA